MPREGDGPDPSNGYEARAREYMALRARGNVGAAVIRDWASNLLPGAAVLDVGCGAGEPVARILVEAGLRVWGIDASPTLVAACRANLPAAEIACEPVEASPWFERSFDGIVAIGLVFLLPEATQRRLVAQLARALADGGELLFTAPAQACTWTDVLTGRASRSLGDAAYRAILRDAGLEPLPAIVDEGGNHYVRARRDVRADTRMR